MSKSINSLLLLVLAAVLCISLAVPAQAAEYSSPREAIRACYDNQLESVDLSQFQLTYETLYDLFFQMEEQNEIPWYADTYSYTRDWDTGIIQTFTPKNKDEDDFDRNLYEREVAEILDATVHPGMADWQIALSIHDYLVANFRYDETYTYYDGYDLLVRGTAVCNGYSEAYMDLLNRAGVPCIKVISNAMNHAWNQVQIGGNWYHVDVTWDDPIPDKAGYVGHDYFLVSDAVISDNAHNHYGWESDFVCSDTSMDTDCFWLDTDSQISYPDSDTSYVRFTDPDQGQYRIYRHTQSGVWDQIAAMELEGINIGEGSYWYPNNGLSLWNGRLYYSDTERVYSMDLSGGDRQTEFYHNAAEHGTYMAGSFVADGIICITLSTHGGDQKDVRYRMDDVSAHEHAYIPEVVEATCTTPGYTVYTCSCGITYTGDRIPALGHVFEEVFFIQALFQDASDPQEQRCLHCDAVIADDSAVAGADPQSLTEEQAPREKGFLSSTADWFTKGHGRILLIALFICFDILVVLEIFGIPRQKQQ